MRRARARCLGQAATIAVHGASSGPWHRNGLFCALHGLGGGNDKAAQSRQLLPRERLSVTEALTVCSGLR